MSGQTVLILGLAREGESLARYFQQRDETVIVTDPWSPERLVPWTGLLNPRIEQFIGHDHPELVQRADRIFVSPGVPPSNPVYRAAVDAGLKIESMTTLFFEICRAQIIGVTGSSGKTTTTGLIGEILRVAGRDVQVGGNIGAPMLDMLPHITTETKVVLELSSFQLEVLQSSPHIAVVTNISPNHLDRHGNMETYIAAKRNIVSHQKFTDYVALNSGDSMAEFFRHVTPAAVRWFGHDVDAGDGATTRAGQVGTLSSGDFQPVLPLCEIPLLGQHNIENVLAALAATSIVGVGPSAQAAGVRSFRPPPHRLECVGERDGVRYIDDSIATSPARASVALQAIAEPVILIAGGRDKNLPWEEFARVAAQKIRALVLLGEAAEDIERVVRRHLEASPALLRSESIRRCDTMPEAVKLASRLAQRGDVVLLSPACTSYDMFTDYEQRGQAFARAVESLNAA